MSKMQADRKTKSSKSIQSAKHYKPSAENSGYSETQPKTVPKRIRLDFEELITAACRQFAVGCLVLVKQDKRSDEYLRNLKSSKLSSHSSQRLRLKERYQSRVSKILESPTISKESSRPLSDRRPMDDSINIIQSEQILEDVLVIIATYNNLDKLCEISFENEKQITRTLMQILGLVVPLYLKCTKMSLKNCCVSGYTIYEMSKFLPLTSITELCLDGSPLSESSYSVLLDKPCRLTSLSLCRCKVDDDSCAKIASKLHFLEPAEATLSILNLSCNNITDVGAKSIGEALRSNRHLRYLNLADNRIDDGGGDRILRVLIDFPLTYDEILGKRRNCFGYQRARQQFYSEYGADWDSKSLVSIYTPKTTPTGVKHKTTFSSLDDITLHFRAQMIAMQNIGQFMHPFMSDSIKWVDNYPYCIGNMILCYLNLSYNNLSYFTVKKICSVLEYQGAHKIGQTGLLRVVIEGNPIPKDCEEFHQISNMLHKNLVKASHKIGFDRKKLIKT